MGGKASKLQAYKLRKKQADSAIYKTRNPVTNEINYEQERIQMSWSHFSKNLDSQQQKVNNSEIDDFLHSLHLPRLKDYQNDILRSKVTLAEINEAITRLKMGISPRADGFTPFMEGGDYLPNP